MVMPPASFLTTTANDARHRATLGCLCAIRVPRETDCYVEPLGCAPRVTSVTVALRCLRFSTAAAMFDPVLLRGEMSDEKQSPDGIAIRCTRVADGGTGS